MIRANKSRALVAADDSEELRRVTEILAQRGVEVPAAFCVPLHAAPEAASRGGIDMLVLVTPTLCDRTRYTIRATRNSSDAHILAIGPATDPRSILAALREGADEYLDVAFLSEELAGAVYRFLDRSDRRARSGPTGNVVAVLGASGGVGTSTIAANLAIMLAKPPYTCGLIDLKMPNGDLTAILDAAPKYSVADFCKNASTVDRTIFDRLFVRHSSGAELLAAPWDARDVKAVTPQTLRLLLAMGRAKFSFQVLDVDNRPDPISAEAIWQANLVLLVLRMDYLVVRNAKRLLDQLEGSGFQRDRVRVVANRFGQPNELLVDHAQNVLGMPIWHTIVDDSRRANNAVNNGKPLALGFRWSTICRNLHGLAAHVVQEAASEEGAPVKEEPLENMV